MVSVSKYQEDTSYLTEEVTINKTHESRSFVQILASKYSWDGVSVQIGQLSVQIAGELEITI